MKHLIVANFKAGKNKNPDEFKKLIEDSFDGLDYEIYETTGPRSVIPFLRKYLKDHKDETVRVYACGGDGTIHEVVSAIAETKNAELAIYPVGTGNDFVKIYGGVDRFLDFKKLIAAEAKTVDLSKLTGESLTEPWYSINVINFGFDAMVGAIGNQNKIKGKKDPYGFGNAILPAICKGRFNKIIVTADGEQLNKDKLLLASVAQGQWIGGEYHASPRSDNTDGLIDVIVCKTMTLFGLLIKLFGKYHDGKHLDTPSLAKKLSYKRAKTVEITAASDVDICVDGEMIRGSHFKVECLPSSLKLAIPEEK